MDGGRWSRRGGGGGGGHRGRSCRLGLKAWRTGEPASCCSCSCSVAGDDGVHHLVAGAPPSPPLVGLPRGWHKGHMPHVASTCQVTCHPPRATAGASCLPVRQQRVTSATSASAAIGRADRLKRWRLLKLVCAVRDNAILARTSAGATFHCASGCGDGGAMVTRGGVLPACLRRKEGSQRGTGGMVGSGGGITSVMGLEWVRGLSPTSTRGGSSDMRACVWGFARRG